MFNLLKRDIRENNHTVKLIHKKVKNLGSGNQSYDGYFFIVKIDNDLVSIEVGNANVFNHYDIGENVELLETQKFDTNGQLVSKRYSAMTPLKSLKGSIKYACKNNYSVYLKDSSNSDIDLQEVILKGEWSYCKYEIRKKDSINTALLNGYDLYSYDNFKDYDIEEVKRSSLNFNEYLSGFDVEINDDKKTVILTIKNEDMIYFVDVEMMKLLP